MSYRDLRESLISEGCELVKLHMGSDAYYLNDVFIARLCNKCKEVKYKEEFHRKTGMPGDIKSVCKACTLEWNKEYKAINKEKIRNSNREYYLENRDAILERDRRYKKANHQKIILDNQRYRAENKEQIAERVRKWNEKHPWRGRLAKLKRRARLAVLPSDFTSTQQNEMLSHFGYACALSGDSENLHTDHVIPVSTGFGGTIKSNMIPLRADLNVSKSDNNIFEWFSSNRKRYGLSQERFDSTIEYLANLNNMTMEEYREYVYLCHKDKKGGEYIWSVS